MTMTVDVDDLATRIPEMLAEVEAGHEVLIARGAETVAPVNKVERPKHKPQEAIDAILEIRKGIPRTTIEEILAWRDEGRR